MFETFEKLPDEVKAFFMKTLVPSITAVGIKIAISAREKKLTIIQVIVSIVTGVGFAYIFSDYVGATFSEAWYPIIIAVIAISGEKIGLFFMYKFNIEKLFDFIKLFKSGK